MYNLEFAAIGTQWRIETESQISLSTQEKLQMRIDQFDKTYSRFRDDSQVAQVARTGGEHIFPDDAMRLFAFYRLLYEISDGKVTPLIGGLLEDMGYDARYSLQVKVAPQSVAAWEKVMWWRGNNLFTHTPLTLDVGAAGKGYLVDLIAEILLKAGIDKFIIDASGDILHRHSKTDRVGLEHPADATKIIGVANLQDKSLCASAANRRAWGGGLHHLLDPHTLKPVQNVVATWVISHSTMLADGLATALFFCEPAKLQNIFDFEYVRVLKNGTIDHSPHFQGELYT